MIRLNVNKFFGPQEVTVLLDGTLEGRREVRERYGYESAGVLYDVEIRPTGELLYRANGHDYPTPTPIHREICHRYGLEGKGGGV